MGLRKRHKPSPKKAAKPTGIAKRKGLLRVSLPAFLIVVLAAIACLALVSNKHSTPKPVASKKTPESPKFTRKAKSLDGLLAMTREHLADVDIAEMNLLCATGLPGAENLDIDKCLATLDKWAQRVTSETERHLYRAHDPRYAEHYQHSENYLRAEFLLQVLQQDLNLHYNMDRVKDVDFRRSQDLFIHGLVADSNGGTCVSMPVVYVAVGRRLGYPLKLVQTKAHVFVRWDDGKERFNIEGAGNGFTSYPDDYYRSWPVKSTDAEIKANSYLVSMSPAEELGSFLASRGHCLLDNGRPKKAFEAYTAAHRLAPTNPSYFAWARQAEACFKGPRYAGGRHRFREPPMVYRNDPLAEADRINAINRANTRRMNPPMPRTPQAGMPSSPDVRLPQPSQPRVPDVPK